MRYADIIERVLFNAFMVGLSLSGDAYFYANPLQVRAGRASPGEGAARVARSGWFDIACCPPNVMRTLASIEHYFATATTSGAQIWQFAPSRLSIEAPGGRTELTVDTDYPITGRVAVRVDAAPAGLFEIAVRVPAWAHGATGVVQSGEPGEGPAPLVPGSLWRRRRSWRPGDELVIELPVRPRSVYPHPRIDAVRGCAAFERGPLVYCLEEVDVGGAERLEAYRVNSTEPLQGSASTIGNEPVVVLRGRADVVPADDENAFPYRAQPWGTEPTETADLVLVPYYVWGNRRPGEAMRVWLPETAKRAGGQQ